jgi:predicted MFS family arabinose efflux permease
MDPVFKSVTSARMPRLLMTIMGASLLVNISFSMYRSIFNNFAGQELGISYAQYGLLEGIREIPGLLTIVLVALVARLADERVYAVCAVFLAAGMWLYATAQTYSDLIVATLVQSIGYHVWLVVQDSLVMKAAGMEGRAKRLGQMNSIAAAAMLLSMGSVWLLGGSLNLRTFFIVGGIAGLGGALISLFMRAPSEGTHQPRFVFRWRYRSYYTLTLLSGARRHIVLTFASFALVKLYGTSVQTMAVLLAVTSFIAIWTRPMIGQLIDKIGEQRALSFNYAFVALVFLGYAFIRNPFVVYGLYIFDNVLTGFDIAVSTHAARIIPRNELVSSLATGLTINHIFGVAVPIIGGLLWEFFGPVIPFLMGVGLVLVAMVYSWNLDARVAGMKQVEAAG